MRQDRGSQSSDMETALFSWLNDTKQIQNDSDGQIFEGDPSDHPSRE